MCQEDITMSFPSYLLGGLVKRVIGSAPAAETPVIPEAVYGSVVLGLNADGTPHYLKPEGHILSLAPQGCDKLEAAVIPNFRDYRAPCILLDVNGTVLRLLEDRGELPEDTVVIAPGRTAFDIAGHLDPESPRYWEQLNQLAEVAGVPVHGSERREKLDLPGILGENNPYVAEVTANDLFGKRVLIQVDHPSNVGGLRLAAVVFCALMQAAKAKGPYNLPGITLLMVPGLDDCEQFISLDTWEKGHAYGLLVWGFTRTFIGETAQFARACAMHFHVLGTATAEDACIPSTGSVSPRPVPNPKGAPADGKCLVWSCIGDRALHTLSKLPRGWHR
jgi:hypothetical protein